MCNKSAKGLESGPPISGNIPFSSVNDAQRSDHRKAGWGDTRLRRQSRFCDQRRGGLGGSMAAERSWGFQHPPRKGPHHAYVSIRSKDKTTIRYLQLKKGLRERKGEQFTVSQLTLFALL